MNRDILDRSNYILTNHSKPTDTLIALMDELNINHQYSPKKILELTQKLWLRKNERWLINEQYHNKKKRILSHMHTLGCIENVYPSKLYHDHILLLGCPYQKFLLRVNLLLTSLSNGLQYKHLYVLSGHRPLDPIHEIPYLLKDYPELKNTPSLLAHESSLIDFILKKHLPKHYFYKHLQHPMIVSNQFVRRPTTEDTIIQWKQQNNPGKRCLVISNQPYVGYQDSVVRTHLEKHTYIETIGNKISSNVTTAVFLDNLTRWLYQEMVRRKLL